MRKILVSNMISLDGFFAGVDGDISWHTVDDEFNAYALELLSTIDTILFGKTTYQIFEDFWPRALVDPHTSPDDRKVAQYIQDAKKIVFSHTMKDTHWENVSIQPQVNAQFISELKIQNGKDIVIFGSGTLVSQLTQLKLIDEYRFIISPTILGDGKKMFTEVDHPLHLHLTQQRSFKNGNVLTIYNR